MKKYRVWLLKNSVWEEWDRLIEAANRRTVLYVFLGQFDQSRYGRVKVRLA